MKDISKIKMGKKVKIEESFKKILGLLYTCLGETRGVAPEDIDGEFTVEYRIGKYFGISTPKGALYTIDGRGISNLTN
ncbi:MAG: hypothetical protein KC516_01325 [Nanoarchaeota archaeon]|nr:hypothetical protein [Nanoarchaeota archaeon]